MRITRIQLTNWKNFHSVNSVLQDRTFLVGPNASGKSNFLDAFRFIQDIVKIGGGFQDAIGRRGGIKRIRCLSARKSTEVSISVDLGDDEDPINWSYLIEFTQDKQRRATIKKEVVKRHGIVILDRPEQEDENDPDRLRHTHLEQINANKDFRSISDFFSTITYLHLVPQLVRDPDRSVGKKNDPYGGDLLENIALTRKATREARLARIEEVFRIAVPQLSELELHRDAKGTPHLRAKYEHWRKGGAWQDEDQFSDGTLRLLGLLWACLDSNGPILLEEPELSLHPEIVQHIPALFSNLNKKNLQFIVSTHSPNLLFDEGIAPDEVLMLTPSKNGTTTRLAITDDEVMELLQGDMTLLAEIVLRKTSPQLAYQLSMFNI
ncbi:MAG: AAA family ATPase [Candidatus Marinimicrobia bacterium]|nr:AAA family ATPase [Candidatus Neomarinimicrobiota bacterium]